MAAGVPQKFNPNVMRQTGAVVLVIGAIGLVYFGIRTMTHTAGRTALDMNPGPFTQGYAPLIISIVVIIVGLLMWLSAGKKIRK